jgi:hypothetical protein
MTRLRLCAANRGHGARGLPSAAAIFNASRRLIDMTESIDSPRDTVGQ